MKSTIGVMLLVMVTTHAMAEVRMPDEYQAELDFGDRHEVVYVSGKNSRWQNDLGDAATVIYIRNAADNVTYEIDVKSKSYETTPYHQWRFSDAFFKLAQERDKKKEAHLELLGTETIDGQLCDHYRLRSLSSSSFQSEDFFWVSKVYGIPIKITSRSGSISEKQIQYTQEWLIRPGPQPSSLFVLPAEYKRSAIVEFATVYHDSSIHSSKLVGRPKTIHTALCEDQKLHKVRYVERHLANPDCEGSACDRDESFDRFEFIDNPLKKGMCLIGDDEYFRGKSILQFSDNVFPEDSEQRPPCDIGVKNVLEKTKGLAIKGCWRLGKFEKTGSFNIAEFVEHQGVRTAALSIIDGSRLILRDWTGKAPTASEPDVWRLGDGGVFHPNENFVLFGLRSGAEIELATVGYGGEGVNYFLNRTNGNAFVEILHEYVYTAGY